MSTSTVGFYVSPKIISVGFIDGHWGICRSLTRFNKSQFWTLFYIHYHEQSFRYLKARKILDTGFFCFLWLIHLFRSGCTHCQKGPSLLLCNAFWVVVFALHSCKNRNKFIRLRTSHRWSRDCLTAQWKQKKHVSCIFSPSNIKIYSGM